MAESMEKPPPYAPPEGFVDPKAGNQGPGYGPQQGVPPTQFMPPGYQPGPLGPDSYPGPQYTSAQPIGQHFPNYGSTVYVHQPPPATQIILVGGCPACRIGVLEDDFTFLGICLAILCFPLGILCCLAMRQRRCPNCGAIFGS